MLCFQSMNIPEISEAGKFGAGLFSESWFFFSGNLKGYGGWGLDLLVDWYQALTNQLLSNVRSRTPALQYLFVNVLLY